MHGEIFNQNDYTTKTLKVSLHRHFEIIQVAIYLPLIDDDSDEMNSQIILVPSSIQADGLREFSSKK